MRERRSDGGKRSLRLIVAVIALCSTTPVSASEVWRWRSHIDEASARFDIPSAWIERVMQAESGGRTAINGQPIRSRAGAIGLMQLMPATWADMRQRLALGNDPDQPRDNILAGTFYLRLMYERFGYPGLFAAYNAGPARYSRYLAGRASLPREAIAYLDAVSGGPSARQNRQEAATTSRPPGLFVVRREARAADGISAAAETDGALFVVRHDR